MHQQIKRHIKHNRQLVYNLYLPAISVLCTGIAISIFLFQWITDKQQLQIETELKRAATNYAVVIQQEIKSHLEKITAISAFYDTSSRITADEFTSLVKKTTMHDYEIRTLLWLPRVQHAERETFEKAARQEGLAGFQFTELDAQGKIVTAAQRAEYFPAYYIEPLINNDPVTGFDHASRQASRKALDLARDSGEMVSTGRIATLHKTGEQYGFLVFQPVYATTIPQTSLELQRQSLTGFIMAELSISDLIEEPLQKMAPAGLHIHLVDKNAAEAKRLLYTHISRTIKEPTLTAEHRKTLSHTELQWNKDLDIPGQQWQLEFRPAEAFLSRFDSSESWDVLFAGLLITALLLVYLLTSYRQTSKVEKLSNQLRGRVKELNCLYSLSQVIETPDLDEYELCRRAVKIIPTGWRYPEATHAMITLNGKSFTSKGFEKTPCKLATEIHINEVKRGVIKVFLAQKSEQDKHPFIDEEQELLDHLTVQLADALTKIVTDRATHDNEERNRILLESSSDGIYAIDPEGICTICNPAAARMLGYESAEQIIGKNAHQLFHHSHSDGSEYPIQECGMRKGMEADILLDNETFWRKDGSSLSVECRVAPMKRNGKTVGAVISFHDISERLNTEIQLRQAQKLESIGQLAAGIAHEINTPTQFVNDNTHFLQEAFADYARLLAAYDRLTESAADASIPADLVTEVKTLAQEIDVDYLKKEIPQAVEQSLEGLARIANIVRAMKEFSHPGTETKTPADLNNAINTTINISRHEWKYCAELITELDAELPQVPVLHSEFNQVILNIIVNAAHAIIDVVGTTGEKGEIRITSQHDGEWAKICISDTGKGMSQAIQKRIFDPFYTTKEIGKGSGQGLAISWSVIVDKHDGSIEVESEENKGTSFTIRLPITQHTASC